MATAATAGGTLAPAVAATPRRTKTRHAHGCTRTHCQSRRPRRPRHTSHRFAASSTAHRPCRCPPRTRACRCRTVRRRQTRGRHSHRGWAPRRRTPRSPRVSEGSGCLYRPARPSAAGTRDTPGWRAPAVATAAGTAVATARQSCLGKAPEMALAKAPAKALAKARGMALVMASATALEKAPATAPATAPEKAPAMAPEKAPATALEMAPVTASASATA
eukprot:363318-Chlamydomonas_euryale.AAC.5